jgi:NADH-quinone oxidoreductase subunit C
MSGVYYTEKNDNRHLLLDYSFLGNPILKSFPVFGYFELIYDGNNNQVIYKKINFSNSEPVNLNYDIM